MSHTQIRNNTLIGVIAGMGVSFCILIWTDITRDDTRAHAPLSRPHQAVVTSVDRPWGASYPCLTVRYESGYRESFCCKRCGPPGLPRYAHEGDTLVLVLPPDHPALTFLSSPKPK